MKNRQMETHLLTYTEHKIPNMTKANSKLIQIIDLYQVEYNQFSSAMEHHVLCRAIRWHTPHTDCGDPVSEGESHNSEELVIQLELFTLSILKVWLVGKIKDCQETDVSYGMSHLLKSCLLSSVQLCRPRPLMCMCLCVCVHVCVCVCVFN